MPASNVIAFYPRTLHTHSHEFVAPDGRYWQANAYFTDEGLDRLEHGSSYTIPQLKRLGLPAQGLAVSAGAGQPVSVVYLKDKLDGGPE